MPLDGLEGQPAIFVAHLGEGVRFGRLSKIVEVLGAHHMDALVGTGIFVTAGPGARALIAVADLNDRQQSPSPVHPSPASVRSRS